MEASVLDRQTNIQPWDEKESEKRGGGLRGDCGRQTCGKLALYYEGTTVLRTCRR